MTITAEDRVAMTDAVRRLFADQHDEGVVRSNMETRSGFDPPFWSALAELGVTGLMIDPDHGGLGGGPLEIEAIMEEAGAALLGAPLLSSFMATALIEGSGDGEAKTRLLPAIAQGRIAALALTGDTGTWTEDGVALIADRKDTLLNGHASFVLHGANAELLFAIARTVDGFGVFEVAPDAAGLNSMPLPTFDRTLRLARLTFEKVPAHRLDAAGWSTVARTLQLGLVALAGEQAGGARRVLEMTTQYAKVRHQFGRAIGSFQAIKHMAANLLLDRIGDQQRARRGRGAGQHRERRGRARRAGRIHLRRRLRQGRCRRHPNARRHRLHLGPPCASLSAARTRRRATVRHAGSASRTLS
jgi:alkylation response protein AidB-like acyl-CoA dehydrogenase